jgi:hypothetical protein
MNSHARFDRPVWMLDRFAALAHGLRVCVEALLLRFEQMLMVSARDPSL